MRYVLTLIVIGLISGCAWFGTPNDSQIPTIAAPPQRLAESNAAMPVITSNKINSSATKIRASQPVTQDNDERIEEDRENGVVDQIKVNNKNLPSYYIYPTQQENQGVNYIPNQNVSVPNWQISW